MINLSLLSKDPDSMPSISHKNEMFGHNQQINFKKRGGIPDVLLYTHVDES